MTRQPLDADAPAETSAPPPSYRPLGLHERALASAGGLLLDGLMASCRYRLEGEEHVRRFRDRGEPVVIALWHGRLLPCAYRYRHQGLVTLISHHRDGEYIARAVQRWGYTVVRGSSSRGGVGALREMVQHVRAGRSLAITPDGPRGPREVMKPGPLLIAQRTGAPIIPVTGAASRAWFFGGWDRFLVPKPGAKVRIACGEPLFVPRRLEAGELEAYERDLERRMGELRERVEQGW